MSTILLTLVGLYVLAMSVFLISENWRPQATLVRLLETSELELCIEALEETTRNPRSGAYSAH